METKEPRLPDKPSELLALALRDLRWAQKSPRYVIDMGNWHVFDDRLCRVCLAGSVMAHTLQAAFMSRRVPDHFGLHNARVRRIINKLMEEDNGTY